jgi:hypothetical protein
MYSVQYAKHTVCSRKQSSKKPSKRVELIGSIAEILIFVVLVTYLHQLSRRWRWHNRMLQHALVLGCQSYCTVEEGIGEARKGEDSKRRRGKNGGR